MAEIKSVVEWLTFVDGAIGSRKLGPDTTELAFSSYEGVVLRYGIEFTPAPLPDWLERGPAKECYSNSLLAAMHHHELFYCEGYATTERLSLPLAHAWLGTLDGLVYDPTWEDGADYFGIPFLTSWALERCLSAGYYGILANDWLHGSQVIKEGLPQSAVPLTFRRAA
jgi:hypothetical protein